MNTIKSLALVIRMVALSLVVFAGITGLESAPAESTAAEATRPNMLSPAEWAEGWILLFDGQTLFGWKPAGQANWSVADGVLTADAGEPGLLHTTCQWGDYQLTLEFRAATATNSGVFLRTPPVVTDVARRAYEVNIAPADNPFPTSSLVERLRCDEDTSGQGWRTMDITADGPRVTVKLDGREVLDYTDPKPVGRGYIGLQFNRGKIEFRNVRLRPLGMKPIFNGRDLSGWKTFPDVKSVFGVTTDGELSVKDGPGRIETVDEYGDFTLQLDVFVRGRGLNSGVFFRCIPGESMNGYESQIHNGFVGGDRTKPVDCGTGGIFRRANARYVVADDFEWFTKTIHVDGPRMAVWVNGYQVTDWTDTRKPDPNPRRGLRLEPGTIQIQGHDPTTDLLFRNLRIAELPKR